jgi:osmoprotectant transport system substrate-binding protein
VPNLTLGGQPQFRTRNQGLPGLRRNYGITDVEFPKAQFGFQNVAPVVDKDKVGELGADFTDTLDAVTEKLTDDAIIAMNSAVAIDQQSPAAVAKQFLQENGLL